MTKYPIAEERIKKMKRRLRKKLHVGEFQQLCFKVYVAFPEPFTFEDAAYDVFLDDFIELIESRGLSLFGMGGQFPLAETDAIIARFRGFPEKTTEEDRVSVLEWLSKRSEVASVRASEMFDGWYGPYPDGDD